MTSQKHIVLLTSDEDLIRQLFLHKTSNTRIIDLHGSNQSTSRTDNNDNMIDLTFLAKLSQPNSTHDYVSKQILETPRNTESKSIKTTEKDICPACVVCGDHATGFNYGAETCASCKTFFRRNALQPSEKVRCLEGQGRCSMSHGTRRKCQQCRLKRCFAMGMKTDYFISEEEKQRRRKRLVDNLHLSPPCPPSIQERISSNNTKNMAPKSLGIEDWLTIQTIESSYSLAFQEPPPPCPHHFSDRQSLIDYYSKAKDQVTIQLITFLRRIKEFEALNEDDRFILMKYNLLPVGVVHKCLISSLSNERLWDEIDIEAKMCQQVLYLDGNHNDVLQTITHLFSFALRATENDFTLLRLLIVVLLFSRGLSMLEDEPPLNDPLAVHRAQSHYTRLIWNYMVDRHGEPKAIKQFAQLLSLIFRVQPMIKYFRDYSRAHFNSLNRDIFTPLMKALLHIS